MNVPTTPMALSPREERRVRRIRRCGKRSRATALWLAARGLFAQSAQLRPSEASRALDARLDSLRLAFRRGSETVAGKKQRRAVHTSEERQWGDARRLLLQASRDRSAKAHEPFERSLAQERYLLHQADRATNGSLTYQAHRTQAERMAAQLQQLRRVRETRETRDAREARTLSQPSPAPAVVRPSHSTTPAAAPWPRNLGPRSQSR